MLLPEQSVQRPFTLSHIQISRATEPVSVCKWITPKKTELITSRASRFIIGFAD